MNRIPIRLGPLALLLTVISICMTTLGVLSTADAGADMRLAQRYADTVRIRYELEEDGQKSLRDADKGTETDTEKTFEREGYTLTVSLKRDGGSYVPELWKLRREWEEHTGIDDLWQGD